MSPGLKVHKRARWRKWCENATWKRGQAPKKNCDSHMETSRCRPVGMVQMEFERLGEMSYQVMRRHGGTFMLSERSPSEKTPTIGHSGKAMETCKKTSGYQRLTGKEGWVSEHRHFGSREIILKLSWWIHAITVKSHRMYTHWTLMETMDFS